MGANKRLHAAKIDKNDEFYTQLEDIEHELKHYKAHFSDKVIYCNCDDPEWSNFYKYFSINFKHLNLKKLISTHFSKDKSLDPAYKQECSLDNNGNIVATKTLLLENGDFRSAECIALLHEADVVVTNPPFSLFIAYITQLVEHDKKFIIVGNKNAITYKEVFRHIQDNKLWLGNGFNAGNAYFKIPPENARNYAAGVYDESTGLVKFRNVGWFTNLTNPKRQELLTLWKPYDPLIHKRYDNYDAINIDRVIDIPDNYDGYMGVPITFLDRYNPNQFDIIRFRKGNDEKDLQVNGKCPYFRIIIKAKAKATV